MAALLFAAAGPLPAETLVEKAEPAATPTTSCGAPDTGMGLESTAAEAGPDSECPATDDSSEASTEALSRSDISTGIAENVQDADSLRRALEGRKIVFFGRAEVEGAWYDVDALDGDSGLDFRRVRAGFAGVNPRFPSLSYKVELDVTEGDVAFSNFYARFDSAIPGFLTLGKQDVSQNLSAMTGSLSQLFMEAPLPVTALSLSPRLSISYDWFGARGGAHGMLFGKDPDSDEDQGDRGVAARAFYNPVRSGGGIFHVGGSFVWENNDESVRLRSRPESHVTDRRLVDTGRRTDVDSQRNLSIELAGATGSISGRIEGFVTEWERTSGGNNRFYGAYIETGYFFTGQSFRYRNGRFLRPRLADGETAWELGMRLSWVDLDDGDIRGGTQTNAGLALNWYARSWLRVMGNLIYVDGPGEGEDGLVAQARLQANW